MKEKLSYLKLKCCFVSNSYSPSLSLLFFFFFCSEIQGRKQESKALMVGTVSLHFDFASNMTIGRSYAVIASSLCGEESFFPTPLLMSSFL